MVDHKPGSVLRSHLSRHTVTGMLERSTRRNRADNPPAYLILLLMRFTLPTLLPGFAV